MFRPFSPGPSTAPTQTQPFLTLVTRSLQIPLPCVCDPHVRPFPTFLLRKALTSLPKQVSQHPRLGSLSELESILRVILWVFYGHWWVSLTRKSNDSDVPKFKKPAEYQHDAQKATGPGEAQGLGLLVRVSQSRELHTYISKLWNLPGPTHFWILPPPGILPLLLKSEHGCFSSRTGLITTPHALASSLGLALAQSQTSFPLSGPPDPYPGSSAFLLPSLDL